MRLLQTLLARPRLLLASALLLAANGALMWSTMTRQEDPRLPDRWALIVVPFAGADAEKVERLVLEPVEEALADVSELRRVEGTARGGVAILNLELRGAISDTDPAWDRVRRKVADARLPAGAGPVRIDTDQTDQESILLALSGAADPLALRAAAERLEDALQASPLVAKVHRTGDPGEELVVALDDAITRRLGLSPAALAQQLAARNQALPGGAIEATGRVLTLRPQTEFETVDELRQTPILLPSGAAIALGEIADVRLRPQQPVVERARVDGAAAVVLGVVPRRGVDVVRFGDAVRSAVEQARPALAPITIEPVTWQPDRVTARLDGLGQSLLLGILIVSGVLIATMGVRMGLVVAAVVPLVAFSTVGIYGVAGGVLHQMSISALVIALGLLVDNAIVVSEAVQGHLDDGATAWEAAQRAIKELALPLGAATGTTLAAFVPMLLAEGPTGDFTRALPIVIMLTLTVSYAFAVLVTPVLAALVQRARPAPDADSRLGARLGRLAVRWRWLVLPGAVGLVAVAALAAGSVPFQFFPSSDRNQLVIDLKLPEGTHLDTIDAAARRVEARLAANPSVKQVASFVGRSAPHFYYNLPRLPQSPHLAQLVVTTVDAPAVDTVATAIVGEIRRSDPAIDLVPRRLEQGPPIKAPIEVRLRGEDLTNLEQASGQVMAALRAIDGARAVRSDLGNGQPQLRFAIDDAAASRAGIARAQVAQALVGRTRGLVAGSYTAAEDPLPVVVRSADGDRFPTAGLDGIDVARPGARPLPLGQVAQADIVWRPAAIRHRNRQRVVTVTALLDAGVTFSAVQGPLERALADLTLPAGVDIELGGAAEGAGEANASLQRAMPIGLFLLLFILLAEFNSFRRVAIILVTVPLAATGVVPGLIVGGQAFGFMSMLGVIALIGIVVNNAIVLLDVADRLVAEGTPVATALERAVGLRARPILLTTATTVAGLIPLALSATSLWPPMAWAMISGLLASTLLTLLVIPALYRLLLQRRAAQEVPA